MKRLKDDWKLEVPYYNIHECARGRFRQCVNDEDNECRESMNEASMMSYCAPLYHLENFGWMEDSVRALTVLRHPVDRVWSMFRFEPRSCYRCRNLTDIYALMDANTTNGYDSLCLNPKLTSMAGMLCRSTGRDLRPCGKLRPVLNPRGGDRPRERQPVRPGRRRLEQQHQHVHGGGGGGRRRDRVGQRHDEQLGIPGAVRCAALASPIRAAYSSSPISTGRELLE